MTEARLIWETLSRERERVVPKRRIAELANRIDLNAASAIRTLSKTDRIVPLFKGFYYLREPNEILLHATTSPLDLFARGAKAKGIGSWYYGLDTALRLNGMTHEYRNDELVISDAFYRPNGITMAGRRFVILKWRPSLTRFGMKRKGNYFWSDPEKTVLDLAFHDYYSVSKGRPATGVWKEHLENVNHAVLESYLVNYPARVRAMIEGAE